MEPKKRYPWGRNLLGCALIAGAANAGRNIGAGQPAHPITAQEIGALWGVAFMKLSGLYLIVSGIWPKLQFRRKKQNPK